ncbi:MAG: hypothetical protein JNL12_08260 [Planctomycetes bacterium]|nr:hypothetical protein [Planctomycetota bacterium]
MPIRNLLLAATALMAPLTAQVVVQATLLQRTVRSGGNAVTWPAAGDDVTGGAGMSVVGAGAVLEHAVTSCDVQVAWSLQCQPPWIGNANVDVDVLYLFGTGSSTPAVLDIDWLAATTGNGAVSLLVDVHDDGVVDATGSAVVPLVVGPYPTYVRVRVTGAAQAGTASSWYTTWHWTGSVAADLAMRLLPTHASVVSLASPCDDAAPELRVAADFAGGVELAAVAGAQDLGVLVFGFAPAVPVVLPWTPGCSLAVAEDVVVLVDLGEPLVASLVVPDAVRPICFDVQCVGVALDLLTVLAGAAFRIDAP